MTPAEIHNEIMKLFPGPEYRTLMEDNAGDSFINVMVYGMNGDTVAIRFKREDLDIVDIDAMWRFKEKAVERFRVAENERKRVRGNIT